jgi:hypothetical protein
VTSRGGTGRSAPGDLLRNLGGEITDRGHRHPVQDSPVKTLSDSPERRPVRTGQHERRGPVTGRREPDIGIKDREEHATGPSGHPTDRQGGTVVVPGELAYLHPDELGQARRAHAQETGVRVVVHTA